MIALSQREGKLISIRLRSKSQRAGELLYIAIIIITVLNNVVIKNNIFYYDYYFSCHQKYTNH